jgi:Protein of unknown function (DUF3592)
MSQNTLAALIFIGIGTLIMLIMGGLAAAQLWGAASSRGWQQTAGQVLSSGVVASRNLSGGGLTDYPQVIYSYSVMGQTYRSDKIQLGAAVGGSGAARAAKRYPAGSAVQVYFNPQHPEQAVLERRSPVAVWLIVIGVVAGGSFCACGLAGMFLIKQPRARHVAGLRLRGPLRLP